MKKRALSPLGSHRNKIVGLVISLISLIMVAIIIVQGPLNSLHKLAHQLNFFLATLIFGMYMVAFSKEKNDDERVRTIRAKAMFKAFGALMASFASIVLASSINSKPPASFGLTTFSCLTIFGLATYLIVFHIGLYFEPSWTYDDER